MDGDTLPSRLRRLQKSRHLLRATIPLLVFREGGYLLILVRKGLWRDRRYHFSFKEDLSAREFPDKEGIPSFKSRRPAEGQEEV
jgi:hypothetical protein